MKGFFMAGTLKYGLAMGVLLTGVGAGLCATSRPPLPMTPPQMQQRIKDLEAQVKDLQSQVDALKGGSSVSAAAPAEDLRERAKNAEEKCEKLQAKLDQANAQLRESGKDVKMSKEEEAAAQKRAKERAMHQGKALASPAASPLFKRKQAAARRESPAKEPQAGTQADTSVIKRGSIKERIKQQEEERKRKLAEEAAQAGGDAS